MDSDDYERKVLQTGSTLTELQETIRHLQSRVDRHSLVIQTLKEMLLSHPSFSEDLFLEKLEIAAALKLENKKCSKCGKAMNAKHHRCIYCGQERPTELL
jgi:ribosomal protein S27AE